MLALLCPMLVNGQGKQSIKRTPPAQETTELTKLHDEYIKATKDYKASLQRLLALYEAALKKAEDRRDQAQKRFTDGLMSQREVEATEEAVTSARLKVTETQAQISGADTQIAQTLAEIEKPETKAKIAREYKRASARQPTCRNWTLRASRQERGRALTVTFKLVCKD
jgi:predicted RNase H-like nuclease (RuvC/YqgF family)